MAFQARSPRRAKTFISVSKAFGCVLLVACLAVMALGWLSLVRSHAQYQGRAEVTTQNLCAVLADNLITSYEKIDLAVLRVKDEVERQLTSGGLDAPRVDALIRDQRARIPVLFALRTANAEGIIEHGNDVPPGSRISVADRDYFMRLKADPNAGLVFSKPLEGRISGKWAFILARRITRRDGSFGGVAYGAVELAQLGNHFASLSVGREGTIALRDADFAVIVHHGGTRDVTGQSLVSPEFRALLGAGRRSGTYAAITAVDQVARIYSFIQLQPYGQYLHVGLGTQEVFEPWRRELRQTIGFVALFLFLLGGSTWMATRAWRRQRRAEADRERVILELQKALAEVKALSGLLPICSNCKKIRDDHGYWNQIEAYIASRSEAQFTHGICPECVGVLFPEIQAKRKARLE